MIVGIDLGTTHSLIATIEGGRARLFTGEDGSTLVPSVVHFPETGSPVVGSLAKPFKYSEPSRTVSSVKRLLGKGLKDVEGVHFPFDITPSDDQAVRIRMPDRVVSPVEISAMVLRKLKALAESALQQPVVKAVVTVPAYFNDSQRQATRAAGELAGLEVVRIVNEPTAACLAYGLNRKAQGTVAIFDLGGGTFDISILQIKNGLFEVLATNGDTELGGDDFDRAIAGALEKEINEGSGFDFSQSPVLRSRLLLACEGLKKGLTDSPTALFEFDVDGSKFERSISREQLAQWVMPVLMRAKAPCLSCLADSNTSVHQITDVILVGGSTRSFFVQEFVKSVFEREPICTLNPDEVVAMGAAVQARILEGKLTGMLLLDVTPLSLGIETVGGIVEKILHRNSTIPTSASQSFTTSVDGQTSVDIHVLQGERELVSDNRSLARFKLSGLPPMPAGVPKIEVEFILDANGILSTRAVELRTGRAASVTVNPTYGLVDEMVEKQLAEAFEHAEADFEARFLAQARAEADAMIRATRKSLQRGQSLLADTEARAIAAALQSLEDALGLTDHKAIQQKMAELDGATRAFAERLLNHSIREALRDSTVATINPKDPQ